MGLMTGAVIASAVIGAGSSIYAANEQSRVAEEQQRKLEEAERARVAEAERIARETRPDAETLKAPKFGTDDGTIGSTSQFEVKKTTSSALGSTGLTAGLGFNV
jgi:hypothetical protein